MIHPGYITVPHAIVTAGLGAIGWAGKYIGGRFVDEWREVKATLVDIQATAHTQTENHLSTIQQNGTKTNELLEKVVENQIELNGWLKGRASRD